MHTSDKTISTIIDSLRHEFTILPEQFYNNFMVLKPDKCSFMLLGVDSLLKTNLVRGYKILKNSEKSVRCYVRQ